MVGLVYEVIVLVRLAITVADAYLRPDDAKIVPEGASNASAAHTTAASVKTNWSGIPNRTREWGRPEQHVLRQRCYASCQRGHCEANPRRGRIACVASPAAISDLPTTTLRTGAVRPEEFLGLVAYVFTWSCRLTVHEIPLCPAERLG